MSQQPLPQPNILDLAGARRQRQFETSWIQLLQSGQRLLALIECRQWPEARLLFESRSQLSRRHFSLFPVGPETREWYRDRLSGLFVLEQEINHLMLGDQRRQAGKRPTLRRVK